MADGASASTGIQRRGKREGPSPPEFVLSLRCYPGMRAGGTDSLFIQSCVLSTVFQRAVTGK